jgi:RNase P subunit RPR2
MGKGKVMLQEDSNKRDISRRYISIMRKFGGRIRMRLSKRLKCSLRF